MKRERPTDSYKPISAADLARGTHMMLYGSVHSNPAKCNKHTPCKKCQEMHPCPATN